MELVHHSDVLYSSALQFYCVWQLSLSDRSGMAASGCLERYLVSSSVLRLYCVLQFLLGRSQWNCYIMDAIWMLGFARNIVFFRANEGSFAEISRLARDGLRHRRFAVDSCSECPHSGTDGSRWLFLFFVAAVLLCFACVETLCALELVHQSDVFYSNVLQFFCVWQLSVPTDRSGMVASRFLAAVGACVILLCFPAEGRKSHCNGSMKVANGALAAVFSSFWRWWFSFSKVLQNRRFSAWASRSGFGAAICVAVVRNSVVLCNSVSAGRRGTASRFLAAAAACRILLMPFAAWRLRMVLWQQTFLDFGASCVYSSFSV